MHVEEITEEKYAKAKMNSYHTGYYYIQCVYSIDYENCIFVFQPQSSLHRAK